VPFTLSTMSICSIEDVAAASPDPFWFQLYVMRDEDFVDAIIERARAANCSALVLTLDLQILGQRHKDLKNGLTSPPKLTIPNILNMMTKPRWSLGMLRTPRRQFRNIVGHVKERHQSGRPDRLGERTVRPQAGLGKVARIRDQWGASSS
jgi:L-lactate dehydrogenase (cytochrome)